jgi:hypothetical protein
MHKLMLCTAILVLTAPGRGHTEEPYNLICDVSGGLLGDQRHTIRVEDGWMRRLAPNVTMPRMRLLEGGSRELTVTEFGADRITAYVDGDLDGTLDDWPAYVTRATFDLDRNTGSVVIMYLRPIRTSEIVRNGVVVARAGIAWDHAQTEVGRCTKAARAF